MDWHGVTGFDYHGTAQAAHLRFMSSPSLIEAALTRPVIGGFYDVYNTLGFGFLEHIYVLGMECELRWRGHHVAREVLVNVSYKGYPTRSTATRHGD